MELTITLFTVQCPKRWHQCHYTSPQLKEEKNNLEARICHQWDGGGGGRGMMRYPHWSMGPCGAHHTSETQLFPLEGARAVNI
jgi:hypothetical protein